MSQLQPNVEYSSKMALGGLKRGDVKKSFDFKGTIDPHRMVGGRTTTGVVQGPLEKGCAVLGGWEK